MSRLLLLLALAACGGTPDGECPDDDDDGVCNAQDVCPEGFDGSDLDADGTPDACDPCPLDPSDDSDGDGVCDISDACVGFDDTADQDADGVADGCDPCPADPLDDSDLDGSCDSDDLCPGSNDGDDADQDGVPDACDPCPADASDDSDGDGVCDSDDLCEGSDDAVDTDGDTVPDGCDPCPVDNPDDTDADGVCDADDVCAGHDDTVDQDGDGAPDACDPCPVDALDDSDGDGVCDSDDLCPGYADTLDGDGDGTPDGCDPCPVDNPDDTDGDGVCDSADVCTGDDATGDSDSDSICDDLDICPGLDDLDPDTDGDGYTEADGDCDDCDALIGPASFDIPGTGLDEDCSGVADDGQLPCDQNLVLTDVDPVQAAAAMDLCDVSGGGGTDFGIVSGDWRRVGGFLPPDGRQHGLLTSFGAAAPHQGSGMVALSSGRARDALHWEACGTHSCTMTGPGTAPVGFPQSTPGCPVNPAINDDVVLRLDIDVPFNATGLRFYVNFYSFEYPEWVCTDFMDQFVVLMNPPPPDAINGNIAMDALGDPFSVMYPFEICDAAGIVNYAVNCSQQTCPLPPNPYCPLGASDLIDTGFDTWDGAASGASGWREVTASVTPGSRITLDFIIWDNGDQAFDSTALIDGFEWTAN